MDLQTLTARRTPALLKEYLGTFWDRHYEDQVTIQALCEGAAFSAQDASDSYSHILACESVDTVPVTTSRRWWRLEIPKSEFHAQTFLGRLDDPDTGPLDDSSPPYMDYPGPRAWSVRVPGLKHAPLITNRLTDPSVALASGTDFWLEEETLHFRQDLFAFEFFQTETRQDGEEVLWAWIWRPGFDEQLIWKHYGYVLNVHGESSNSYRKSISTTWKALVGGSSLRDIVVAFSAATGIAVAEGGEIVEDIVNTDREMFIATDRSILQYPVGSTPRVQVGDTLSVGESGIEESGFVELRKGIIPSEIKALTLEANWISAPITGGLLFENRELPLTVVGNQATFPVYGSDSDVEAYWESIREGEQKTGKTLLDLIRYHNGESPTINPASFIAKTSLQQVGLGYSSGDIARLPLGGMLRELCPPHAALLIVLQLHGGDESTTVELGFGSDSPGDLWDAIPEVDGDIADGWLDSGNRITNQGADCP